MKQRLFFSNNILTAIVFAISGFLISGCGSSQQFVSVWPEKIMKIDGNSEDWEGNLQAFPKDKYSIGFRNDKKFLYLCFITSDRDKILNIMRSGMNVYFNSPTDEAKNYYIKFPLINPGVFRESISVLGPDAMQKESISFLFQEILDKQIQFNLVQKDFINTISLLNKENIEVKAGIANENLVLELKVPLASENSSFPIGALPGEQINIKFETDPARVAFREGAAAGQNAPGAQPSGGGRGGRGGRGGGNAGGQPSMGGDEGGGGPINMAKKFNVEFTLQLLNPAK